MTTSVLVPPQWLETHLHDPAVRVVEVDVSRLGYDEWHIPGATLWDVYRDLKDAEYRTVDAAAAERLLARSGSTRTRPSCSTGTPPPSASGC